MAARMDGPPSIISLINRILGFLPILEMAFVASSSFFGLLCESLLSLLGQALVFLLHDIPLVLALGVFVRCTVT